MEKLLRITNLLLGIIALCLVLLVVNVYRVDVVATAHAQTLGYGDAKPVYLIYLDEQARPLPVVA